MSVSPIPDTAIIGQALGFAHRRWLLNPGAASLLALSWHLCTLLAAYALGILWSFKAAEANVMGFATSHWGIVYLVGMPVAAFFLGLYFRLLDNALQKLDQLIRPVDGSSGKNFSEFLAERFRLQWSAWIFPASVLIPIVLTVIADGRDIVAPLQPAVLPPSTETDWATVGYLAKPYLSPVWYFGFNLAAWAMQIFVGYCGMLVVLLTASVLGTVFRYGLGGKRVADLFVAPSAARSPVRYRPEWNYKERRCGLESMDWVFLFFIGLNLVILVLCATSILANVYVKGGADLGSAILALATMILVPLATFWVFIPYFANFPNELPPQLREQPGYVSPSPWPFGSERLTWVLIGITSAFWFFLLYQVLESVLPGFQD